jgi:hypothetical protein
MRKSRKAAKLTAAQYRPVRELAAREEKPRGLSARLFASRHDEISSRRAD